MKGFSRQRIAENSPLKCASYFCTAPKDGGLANPDDVLAFYQKEWAAGFGPVTTHGVPQAQPPKVDSTKNPWLPEHKSLAEQTRIYKQDPALAKQMMVAAGI